MAIKRLRDNLENDPAKPQYIKTIYAIEGKPIENGFDETKMSSLETLLLKRYKTNFKPNLQLTQK